MLLGESEGARKREKEAEGNLITYLVIVVHIDTCMINPLAGFKGTVLNVLTEGN